MKRWLAMAIMLLSVGLPVAANPYIELPAEAWLVLLGESPEPNTTHEARVDLEFNDLPHVMLMKANFGAEIPDVFSGAVGSNRSESYTVAIGDVDWLATGFDYEGRGDGPPHAIVYQKGSTLLLPREHFTKGPSITITNESINIGPAPMRAPYQILIGNGTDLANITSMVALPHNETSLPRPGGVVVAAWLVDVEWLHWSQKVGGGVCHPGCEVPRYVVFDGLNVTMPEAPETGSEAPVPESPGAQESPLPLVLVVLALVAALRRR